MKAVILAGGVRSGLEVPGSNLPRALWPFPSEPLITEVIRFLRRHDVDAIAICANGKTRMIASELSSGARPWLDIHYSEDSFPRGPAGCLRDLKDWLGEDDCIAIQGTGLYDFDLPALLAAHRASGAAVTVAGARAEHTIVPAGVYVLQTSALDLVSPVGYQDMKEQFLPRAIQQGLPVRGHVLAGEALLIHSVEHYLAALERVMPRIIARGELPAREVAPGAWAHPTARISDSCRIVGPVYIDQNARVEAGAVIVGPAVLGPDTYVGSSAVVHRAVLMRGASVPDGTQAANGVFTRESRLAPRRPVQDTADSPRGSRLRRLASALLAPRGAGRAGVAAG